MEKNNTGLDLGTYNIERLEDYYELECKKVSNRYLVTFSGQKIESTNMLDNYINWHDISNSFHMFSDNTEDWEDMSNAEQAQYLMLEKLMNDAEDRFFN